MKKTITDWCARCNYLEVIADYYEHGDELAAVCQKCLGELP